MGVLSLGQGDPLEEEMATHSSILVWRFPWTEEPSRLQSMGSQRVRHSSVTEHTSHREPDPILEMRKYSPRNTVTTPDGPARKS